MLRDPAYLTHFTVGAVAIGLWWATFLQRKGSAGHKGTGRWFLVALAVVLGTVGGIFFLSARVFAAPEVIQFSYLVLCVVTVGGTAFAAIRLKRDVERFRGPLFRIVGIAAFLMGGVVLAAGIATANPMPVIFSVIGLLYGGAMIRFAWFRGPLHPNWWLGWHLNGMTFLFNAVHGTFFAQIWLAIIGGTDPAVSAVSQIGTMAVSLWLRLYYGRRFNAPLRFRAPDSATASFEPAVNHA